MEKQSQLEKVAGVITKAVGSPTSIIFHTILFVGIFILILFGFSADQVMLILTTAVSLEAIYLSLLIQMTVNQQAKSLTAVEEDIEEIQEDVEQIEEDIDEIQEDVEEIQDDVEEIEEEIEIPYTAEQKLASIEAQLHTILDEMATLKQTKLPQKTLHKKTF